MNSSHTNTLVGGMGGWGMVCLMGLLLLGVGLACGGSSRSIPAMQGTADPMTSETIFWEGGDAPYSLKALDGRTGSQAAVSSNLQPPSAVLAQKHYVVGHHLVGLDGRAFVLPEGHLIAPTGDRAAYVQEGDLYTRRLDGAEWALVAQGASHPTWSADGRLLAYTVGGAIWAATAEGSHSRQLVTGHTPQPIAWSPTGAQLLYRDGGALLVIGSDGNGRQELLATGVAEMTYLPVWTADGQQILLQQRHDGRWKLVRLTVATGRTADVVVWERGTGVEAWAANPAGGQIAFVAEGCVRQAGGLIPFTSTEVCKHHLYVVGENGRNLSRIGTVTNGLAASPMPPVVWTSQRPPLTLPPAGFDQRDIPPAIATTATTVGWWEPAPFHTAVHNGDWTVEVREVVVGDEAMELLRPFVPSHQVRPTENRYTAVRVHLTYHGQEARPQLNQPFAFRSLGGVVMSERIGNIEERQIDPALAVALVGEPPTAEGWVFIRLRLSDPDPEALIFRLGGGKTVWVNRYLSLATPADYQFAGLPPAEPIPVPPINDLGLTADDPAPFGEEVVGRWLAVRVLEVQRGSGLTVPIQAAFVEGPARPSLDRHELLLVRLHVQNVLDPALHLPTMNVYRMNFAVLDEAGEPIEQLWHTAEPDIEVELLKGHAHEGWVVLQLPIEMTEGVVLRVNVGGHEEWRYLSLD